MKLVSKRRVAVVGYGNIGQYAVQALLEAPDLELAGVVRRRPLREEGIPEDIPVVSHVTELGTIDAALLCVPTRSVPETAEHYLAAGISTVDSFDLHGDEMVALRRRLDSAAKAGGAAAVIAAGWDPGTDSVVRALLEAMAPRGVTYTNFGPGVSMGHSTVVRSLPGVADAASVTIPVGSGLHRRVVYVQLEPGAKLEDVRAAVLADPYFRNDETIVVQVPSVRDVMDVGHGVRLERKGVSSRTHNQQFLFDMRINNPALTAQVMVAAARAAVKQPPGAYTLLEVPVIDLLPGEREELIRRLV